MIINGREILMPKSSTIDDAISFAEAVLAADPKKGFRVEHAYKYFSGASNKNHLIDASKENQVIFTGPGKARVIEILDSNLDKRSGLFPQHNSVGIFPEQFEINPSQKLSRFQGLSTANLLEDKGFFNTTAILTKKKLSLIQNQFANLSPLCFEEMMCISSDAKQRDFNVWACCDDNGEIIIAYMNPYLEVVQFFQSYRLNESGQIIDVKHVVCETGIPIVLNQTMIDCYGNHRNIAHVGVTGSKVNSFYNSLERFDDGSLVWTSSDYKFGKNETGSAVLLDDGSIKLLEGSNLELAQFSARNLGAEAIDPKTLKWKGEYSIEGCISEDEDKYITRREYKAQVRKKVNQIIDGACIPGLSPIFLINI
jgi:hypothetical protein